MNLIITQKTKAFARVLIYFNIIVLIGVYFACVSKNAGKRSMVNL